MTNLVSDVKVFMEAVGQTTKENNIKQSELYKTLIEEEYKEWQEANDDNNDVERLDACFDMIWVIIGYMLSRGWEPNKAWNEGALSNLSKIDRVTKKVLKREDGKILKPEGWKPPDFSKFI